VKKERKHVSMRNQVREELAQKHYLNPDSPGYLNEVKARKFAGYSDTYAKSASGTLWEKADIGNIRDILPHDSENIGEELKKWLELIAKWQKKLGEVDDPIKLGSRTVAVMASYIKRLAKMFGLIIDRQEKREMKAQVEEKMITFNFETPKLELDFVKCMMSIDRKTAEKKRGRILREDRGAGGKNSKGRGKGMKELS